MEPKYISIRGARMHNLKNINVDLPRNSLVVFTGLSGSGKSSLAFDTLYAEGQRRYVESLSTYARQFLGQMEKPDVDSLEGLSPAVSIEQRTTSRNPRSTVGTITEIYDHLRLLFARVGRAHCPECGDEIRPQSVQDMVSSLLAMAEGTKVLLLAPLVNDKKGEHLAVLNRLRRDGFVRARIDGEVHGLEEEIVLEKNKRHTIEAVVDRLVLKPSLAGRLSESVATAVRLSEGLLLLLLPESGQEILYSERAACVRCGQECGGLGVKQFFDPQLVVPNPRLSLNQGAIAPWAGDSPSTYTRELMAGLARQYGFALDTPFAALPEKARQVILHGSGSEDVVFDYIRFRRLHSHRKPFAGILPQLGRRWLETDSASVREELEQYMNEQPCPACLGARLRPEALAVRIGPWNIHGLSRLSIAALLAELPALDFNAREMFIAERIIKEILDRLTFLHDVGLSYISLERRAATLSGGEAQRIRLASQIGSRLAGVLYILDEPSIGLHQRDNQRLINTLIRLRDLGNTVLVVEHDGRRGGLQRRCGRAAARGEIPDRRLSLRPTYHPAAGETKKTAGQGGLAEHPPGPGQQSAEPGCPHPVGTHDLRHRGFRLGQKLAGHGNPVPRHHRLSPARPGTGRRRRFCRSGADRQGDRHRPESHRPHAPLQPRNLYRHPHPDPRTLRPPARSEGPRLQAGPLQLQPQGRPLRGLRGGGGHPDRHAFSAGHLRYLRCLPWPALQRRYPGHRLSGQKHRRHPGHERGGGPGILQQDQSSVTLSGGEAQRIKLAKELARRSTGKTLYILDEPTTGLHPADIRHLLHVLDRLVESGNSVVIIEHNLDVIKTADHVIDLGPEGGDQGGRIVAQGTPEQVARTEGSHTGRFLAEIIAGEGKK